MTSFPIEQQLLEVVRKLNEGEQQQVLAYAQALSFERKVSGRSLLRFAGAIPLDDLERMENAIEDCEKIDPDEW
jgi:hypothetical protein